jgi:hypothetical protein
MAVIPYLPPNISSFSGNAQNVAGEILIGSLSDGIMASIDHSITNVSVEYSMSEASQLSFDVVETMSTDFSRVIDPEKTHPRRLEFAYNNYFNIGRDVIYETRTLNELSNEFSSEFNVIKQSQLFEIATVTFSPGPGGSPTWQVKCFSKAIQQMKRDRNPGTIKGTGSNFVKLAAEKYGLKSFVQETSKKPSITKATGDKHADSLWDVLTRMASDAKFVIFEVDGYLVFASERYLMNKWGIDSGDTIQVVNKKTKQKETKPAKYIPLQYPAVFKGTPGYFFAMGYPTINVSNNDPRYGDGSIEVDRQNGTQIRPGMTAYIGDVPGSNGYYLIDSVSFNDRSPDPVSISFRKPTPEVDKPREIDIGLRFIQTSQDVRVPTRVTPKNGVKPRPAPPDARYFPLPTADTEYNFSAVYPRMKSGIIEIGNIPLYSRPVMTVNGEVKTTFSITKYIDGSGNEQPKWQSGYTALLITPIWTVGGIAVELTEAEAYAKYQSDGLFLAKLDSPAKAATYGDLIHRQQIEILRVRFPDIDFYSGAIYPNTPGLT